MTYLQSKHPDFNNLIRYAAISDEQIETLDLYQAYGEYGQQIGHDNAGDCLEILTQEAADAANEAWNEHEGNEGEDYETKYKVGDVVSAYNDSIAFDALIGNEGVGEYISTGKGFTYWTGSNHKTIILESDNPDFEGEWSIVYDDEIIAELEAAIENMEFVGESTGIKSYKSEDGKWGIDDSCWQGTWAKYDIMLMEDVERLAAYPEYE
jgi:hypothetical protein